MKSTIDLEALLLFRTVVEAKSFTAAGDVLNKDKAHISRVISRLEKRLGVSLLHRSTRSLNVTETGADFYQRAVSILDALAEAEAAIDHAKSEPYGTLKVNAGGEFGQLVVNDWVKEYLKRYPKVRIEAEYNNRSTDIIHEGIDVSVIVGKLDDSDLSARTLGQITYGLYASPAYLRAHDAIQHPRDLNDHPLIMFAPRGRILPWLLVRDKESVQVDATPLVTLNNIVSIAEIVTGGIGVSLLPRFHAQPLVKSGRLEHILPDWTKPPVPVSAVFASSRYMTPKVRAFIDLAIDAMKTQST